MSSIQNNVLVVRWGTLRIHDYYFALMLQSCGFNVTFAIYTPHYSYQDRGSIEIRNKVISEFEVIEEKGGFLSRQVLRLGGLIEKATGRVVQSFYMNDLAARRLSIRLGTREFSQIIPIEHSSLRFATIAFPSLVKSFLYYSLEINQPSDTGLSNQFRDLIKFERTMTSGGIAGLLIQDKYRAEALIGKKLQDSPLRICFLPVSVPGPNAIRRCQFFNELLNIPKDKKIVLYFGAVYGGERKLDSLLTEMNQLNDDRCVMVLHGSKEFRALLPEDTQRVRVSEAFVACDQLEELIQSCDVGIALYDNNCLNTRLTAFSSEKITRYLQCGKPFIAFRNESTTELRRQFLCCELIEDVREISLAINVILDNYEHYSEQCRDAFDALYSQEVIASNLASFLKHEVAAVAAHA